MVTQDKNSGLTVIYTFWIFTEKEGVILIGCDDYQ